MAKQSFILSSALEQISRQITSLKQESTLRQYFVEALNKFLEVNGLDFAQLGPLFALDERVINGKPDANIGALMFETKLPKPKGAGIDAAVKQLKGYLDEGAAKGLRCRGIAYDGVRIVLLNEEKKTVFEGTPEAAAPILESWLLLLAGSITDPNQMVNRFGSDSAIAQTCIRTFHKIFSNKRHKVPFIEEVFEVWQALYGCAANLNSDAVTGIERAAKYLQLAVTGKKQAEEFLFSLETYLSILLKLLVVRVAVEQKLIPHRSVREVLYDPNGAAHRRYQTLDTQIPHLKNVFEADTFVWFADAAEADQATQDTIANLLLSLADLVDAIRLVTLRQDFLQVFYQQFFEPAARRALGEFYTNRDLVRETLDIVGYDGTDKGLLIDISCGSGNFLVEAISRRLEKTRSKSKAERLTAVTEQIFGADIHPLAVAMARVNYLISIGDLLSEGSVVTIPIFWADSLSRLTTPTRSGTLAGFGVPVGIQIPGLQKFELPHPSEANWDLILDTTRDLVHARPGKVTLKEIWPRFVQEVGEDIAIRFEDTLTKFISQVIAIHNNGRDMRWLPLLRNVLSIENLRGRCAYVVGNPPWVRTHNIEDAFRKRINEDYHYCRTAGWERGCTLANIGRGFARQTDLCIPFVERSLELLNNGGKLGFVITSKIQQALYANALRRDLITNYTILKIVDYSLHPVPLFVDAVNYPMILGVQNTPPSDTSKVKLQIHNLIGESISDQITQRDLPSLRDDVESPWLMAPATVVQIIRKLQRGVMLGSEPALRARMGIKAGATADYVITRLARTDRKNLVFVESEAGKRFNIEKELIFPLVRGEDIKDHSFVVKSWIIFPHDPDSGAPLEKLPSKARAYFTSPDRKARLEKRTDYDSSDPFWTMFRVTADKLVAKVAWSEISMELSASPMPEFCDDEILGTRKLIPLQTAYLIPTESAELLAGVLNSTAFRTQMYAFAERARGGYFRHFAWTVGLGFLPQPVADSVRTGIAPKDTKLVELNTLLKQRPTDDTKADALVSTLFGLTESEHNDLSTYCRFIAAGVNTATLFEDNDVES